MESPIGFAFLGNMTSKHSNSIDRRSTDNLNFKEALVTEALALSPFRLGSAAFGIIDRSMGAMEGMGIGDAVGATLKSLSGRNNRAEISSEHIEL